MKKYDTNSRRIFIYLFNKESDIIALMQIQAYLDRINYKQSVRADVHTLRGLHRAHMFAVPFENLDIVPLREDMRRISV